MSEYGKQVKNQMDTYMNNPDSIDKEVSDIQNATHGVEVRGALAAGVKKSFDKSVEAETISENAQEQVNNIQSQVNQLVVDGDSSVEAAQARVDSEGNTYSTLKERLDDKEGDFYSRFDQTIRIKTCSDLGLTTDDDGVNNFNILTSALEDKTRILVDGFYKLKPQQPFQFNYNIDLKGITDDAGFDLIGEGTTTFFSTSVNNLDINIDKVKFINETNHTMRLFLFENSTLKINSFKTFNCDFEGKIQLFAYFGNVQANPESIDYGVQEFLFKYNKVKNIPTTFIRLNDCPHELIECSHNRINNWDYVVFTSTITNTHSFPVEIHNAKKTMIIRGNYGYSDTGWFRPETSNSTYYALAIFEGKKIIYEYNRVEGLKSRQKTAVYDLYANCDETFYFNNIFKNNACVATLTNEEDHTRSLIKSKSGGYKKYYNNQYIVEESFLNQLGVNPLNIGYKLYDADIYEASYEIKGNKFNVPYLRGLQSSSPIKRMEFKDNEITTRRIDYFFFNTRSEGAILEFHNNNVEVNGNSDSFVRTMDTVETFYKAISIKNNTIHSNDYLLRTVQAEEVSLVNNVITGMPYIALRGIFGKIEVIDTLLINNSQMFLFDRTRFNEINMNLRMNISKYLTREVMNLFDYRNSEVTETRKYIVEMTVLEKNNIYPIRLYFELRDNEITYTSNEGTSTLPLEPQSNSVYATMARGGKNEEYKIRFKNTSSETCIFIEDESSPTGKVIDFKIYSVH